MLHRLKLYLIEILHQTTTIRRSFYSVDSCILSKFYIKPQQQTIKLQSNSVVSYRNSTSNHNIKGSFGISLSVVSYRNSTSNHNTIILRSVSITVVSYRNSTSNHNASLISSAFLLLYLIEILHQTTTLDAYFESQFCCILSKFYIKPQQCRNSQSFLMVVSYRNSTSNHNLARSLRNYWKLYLIEILHQTTTSPKGVPSFSVLYLIEILHQTTTIDFINARDRGCILSKFYIKPQHRPDYWRPRSSCILSKFYIKPQLEDSPQYVSRGCILSKFYIKPQQIEVIHNLKISCILSKFYIKPQHFDLEKRINYSCILSKFYIKPQLRRQSSSLLPVVSYRNSTSNHNFETLHLDALALYLIEILHQTTTEPPTPHRRRMLYLIEILHQTTTMFSITQFVLLLYLIEILHQTTTDWLLEDAPA